MKCMKLRLCIWVAAFPIACTGGQTGVPVDDDELVDAGECHPDAATLGFSADDLRAKVEGTHTFTVPGSAFDGGFYVGRVEPKTFVFTISRSDEPLPQRALQELCAERIVPARVAVRSTDPELDVAVLGTIAGSPEDWVVSFPARGLDAGLAVRLLGLISQEPDAATKLYVDVGGTHWGTPVSAPD